jgi:hypothetical protein
MNKIYIYVVLGLCFLHSNISFAQKLKIDSLIESINSLEKNPNFTSDTNYINGLNDFGFGL